MLRKEGIMGAVDERIVQVKAVQSKYTQDLLKKPHVIGVSVGRVEPDTNGDNPYVLVVLVDQLVPNDQLDPTDRIPETLDGVKVVVRQVGTFEAL
jgi:hypothetical protein